MKRAAILILVASILVLNGCGEDLNEEQLYEQAKVSEKTGAYDDALEAYQKLAKNFAESDKGKEASKKVAIIQKAQTLGEQELYAEIERQETREEFESAIILYSALINRFPDSDRMDEALHKLGLIYLNNQEQYDKSVQSYQRLLNDFPDSRYAPQGQFMIGYIYANHIEDLGKAREAYESFQQKYPDHELITSVNWELEHLGQDISEIDIFSDTPTKSNGVSKKSAPAGN